MLVFSHDLPTSAEAMAEIYDDITKVRGTQWPMVVVANKCDLEVENQQVVNKGMEMAKHWNVPFFQVSAKNRTNIEEAYFELVRQIRTFESQLVSKKKSNCCLQ